MATGFLERLGLASQIKTASLKPTEEERANSTLRNAVGTSMGSTPTGQCHNYTVMNILMRPVKL
jgi:hypothetical protein